MKLCECGCGQPAPIAKQNYPSKGHVKGQPVRFITGHNNRGRPKSAETRARMAAYAANRPVDHHEKLVARRRARPLAATVAQGAIHSWLIRHHPKAGVCERCRKPGRTDYAFIRHPAPYTRDRLDYLELCRACHTAFDVASGIRPLWIGVANPARIAKAKAAGGAALGGNVA